MSHRRIGPEAFGFAVDRIVASSLDDLARLIDWALVDQALLVISCGARGEPAWPPLALFKAMLLSIWYDLSDVRLAEALDDRASFRRFCGFSGLEPTPERTAFVRFRRSLAAHGLDKPLFDTITGQLKARVPSGCDRCAARSAQASQRANWMVLAGEDRCQQDGPAIRKQFLPHRKGFCARREFAMDECHADARPRRPARQAEDIGDGVMVESMRRSIERMYGLMQ